MDKRTWKIRSLPDVSEAVRTSPSMRAAAAKVGVNVSTISRLIKSGKLQDHQGRSKSARQPHVPTASGRGRKHYPTFTAWAKDTFVLSAGELELVGLAQQALDLARDQKQSPTIQLQASAQFRAIWRELRLPVEAEAASICAFPRKAV